MSRGKPVTVHGSGQRIPTEHGGLYMEIEGDGPPVLIVTGGPGTHHASAHPWFSRLARDHQVVYFDHLGTGRSEPLHDASAYSVELFAGGIDAIRRHLGHETVALVGLSFGGMPTLAYVAGRPETVSAVVLSGAQMSADTWQRGNIDNLNDFLRRHFPDRWARLEQLRADGIRSLDARYGELLDPAVDALAWYRRDAAARPAISTDPEVEAFREEVYTAVCGPDPEWRVGGTMAGFDPLPGLADLGVPALVATGRWDGMVTPELAMEAVRAFGASGRLHVFDKSGHRPYAEEPDAYFTVVNAFLHETRTSG